MATTIYQVRCEKDDNGGYVLRYGRQGKQLSAPLTKIDKNIWGAGKFTGPTKSEVKEKWGAWAKANYSEGSPNGPATMVLTAEEVADATKVSSPPKLGGPPKLGAKPAPVLPARPPSLKPVAPPLSKQDAADPFSALMRYPSDHPRFPRETTPLGLLVEIRSWYLRYKDRVDSVNKVLTADNQWPSYNPFLSLINGIDEVLQRESPNVLNSTEPEGDEESSGTPDVAFDDNGDTGTADDLQGDDINAGLEDPNLITIAPGLVADEDGEYEDPLRS